MDILPDPLPEDGHRFFICFTVISMIFYHNLFIFSVTLFVVAALVFGSSVVNI